MGIFILLILIYGLALYLSIDLARTDLASKEEHKLHSWEHDKDGKLYCKICHFRLNHTRRDK